MANHVQLDEGSSGKYTETEEVSSGIHRQVVRVAGVYGGNNTNMIWPKQG